MKSKIQSAETLIQTPHLVAVIDFLGAKSMMTTPVKSDMFLQKIFTIYDKSMEKIKLLNKVNCTNIKARIFSDNVLLSRKLKSTENVIKEFIELQCVCKYIQTYAFEQNLIVRGAITKGNFYINNRFVYGEALVRAHQMETTIAKYPRIMIDPTIFSNGNLSMIEDSAADMIFKSDEHGILYLKVFDVLLGEFLEEYPSLLLKMKATIVNGYSEAMILGDNILQKYIWLVKEFNSFCDQKKLNEHKILLATTYSEDQK